MLTGGLRSGKTLTAVWLALNHHVAGKRIYSNFNISFVNKKDIMPAEILMLKDLKNCTLVLDELWTIIDSRASISGENKFLSDIILGSGKDGVTIIGTSQMAHMVDKRYRDIADYMVLCERKGKTKSLNAVIKAHIMVRNFWAKSGYTRKTEKIRVRDIAPLYDTTEKIQQNRYLLIEGLARYYEKDERLMKKLRGLGSVTDQRDALYTYAGVKRSNQLPILQEMGLRKLVTVDSKGMGGGT